MVEFKSAYDHNVVSMRRGRDPGRRCVPQIEAALEDEMNFMPGLDREDAVAVLKISGVIFAALVISAALTVAILAP